MSALRGYADQRMLTLTTEAAELARARIENRNADAPRLSLSRILVARSSDGLDGEDREALAEYARRAGAPFDPHRPLIPFAAFRDLTKATASAAGYLVSAETQDAIDILRPFSVTARMGLLVETGLVGDQAVPKVTAKSTPEWLATEGSQATPSQPTLAQIVLTPKSAIGVVNFSRQLSRQANAEAFARRELMRTIGTAVDQAVLNGSGASGQPTGLLLTAGVQSQTGTTLNHAGTTAMKQKSATANADDLRVAFLSTPAVRELLENRLRTGNGSRYVWDEDKIADRPGYVSTDVPSATMICGDFGNIYLGIWGEAFVLEINPFDPTHFKTGVIQARIILPCDVAVLHAASFVKSESIT